MPTARTSSGRVLISSAKVLERFRLKFIGKCSPVHFFWGSFATWPVRAFPAGSRRRAKASISGPGVFRMECAAPVSGLEVALLRRPRLLFLRGTAAARHRSRPVRPAAAGWNSQLSEFILMYDDVRTAASPEQALYEFLESTYEAAARLAKWDRAALEI